MIKKIVLLFVFVSQSLIASAFINSSELAKQMKQKDVVVIDVADEKTYNKGHIPGAIRADVGDFRKKINNQYALMRSSSEIESLARSLGINANSKVVLYGHGGEKELLKASYIALALVVNGHKDVSILDGGYAEWMDDQSKASTKTPNVKQGNFVAKYDASVLVDLEYVKQHINKVPMIEARPLRYFTGEAQSSGVRRLGHITGAKSSFWKDKFMQDETVLSDKELREIYIKGHKLDPKKELIVYCTGGLEASMNWFLTTQQLGFKNVKVYDASMREWGNRDDTPMER